MEAAAMKAGATKYKHDKQDKNRNISSHPSSSSSSSTSSSSSDYYDSSSDTDARAEKTSRGKKEADKIADVNWPTVSHTLKSLLSPWP